MTEGGEPRTVLVTGGSRGIGLAFAIIIQAQPKPTPVPYATKPPPDDLFALKCDVTSVSDVDATFTAVEERYGPVEVLVANAGINHDGLLLRMGEEQFTSVIDTNLAGTYRVAKRAAAGMVEPAGSMYAADF